MENFICHSCKQEKPVQKSGGTGYGINSDGEKVCYQCAAEKDKQALRRLKPGQRYTMYINTAENTVSNWSGGLEIKCRIQRIRHNWCKKDAFAVSFVFEDYRFYGRYIGFNHTTLKVTKAKI